VLALLVSHLLLEYRRFQAVMRAIATISQSALLYNLSVVKKYAPQAKVVAMVKANAYGHHLNLVTPLRLIHWVIALICTSKVTHDTFNMNQWIGFKTQQTRLIFIIV
jgi:hypothetical protein